MKPSELLSKRGAWTQNVLARMSKNGLPVVPTSSYAVCWCAVGAIDRCYPRAERLAHYTKLAELLVHEDTLRYMNLHDINDLHLVIGDWNDVPSRRKGEVIAKLKEAGL